MENLNKKKAEKAISDFIFRRRAIEGTIKKLERPLAVASMLNLAQEAREDFAKKIEKACGYDFKF